MKEEPNKVEEAAGEGTLHEPCPAAPDTYPQMPGCPTDPPSSDESIVEVPQGPPA